MLANFNFESEIIDFSARNQEYVRKFPLLNTAIDRIFGQIAPSNQLEMTVYMLGRLCARAFEALFVLATIGHGSSAQRLLRSLFEKVVDLEYLSQNPQKLEDFVDFDLVECKKLGLKCPIPESDYETRTKRFKNSKGSTRWTGIDLVSQARKVGFEDWFINGVYRVPNRYVHTSVAEIIQSIETEKDGSLSAVLGASKMDRSWADYSLLIATDLIKIVLRRQLSQFCVDQPSEFQEFFDKFSEFIQEHKTARGTANH